MNALKIYIFLISVVCKPKFFSFDSVGLSVYVIAHFQSAIKRFWYTPFQYFFFSF